MINFIIFLAVVIALFFAWFVYSWVKQSHHHKRYIESLSLGDKIKYLDEDLNICKGLFVSRNGIKATIINSDGFNVTIYIYEIMDDYDRDNRI